jgi:hypothetical protein
MGDESHINFDHPANVGILRYLNSRDPDTRLPPSASPGSVPDPYYTLGTHPELVQRLWDELGAALPEKCGWVVYGRPVLAHPQSGIVFGFAGGSLVYALRLPEAELREATLAGSKRVHTYSNGTTLDVSEIGEEWTLGGWFADEERWCLAAYRFAGEIR